MKWQPGDKFVVCGPIEELNDYGWDQFIGTVQTVYRVYSAKEYETPNPIDGETKFGMSWIIKEKHMRPLTKLDRVLL